MNRVALALLAALATACGVGTEPARADAAPAAARPRPAGASLCAAAEAVVFNCPVAGGRWVSVCGSPDLSTGAGVLHYRFGRPGQVEMERPPVGDATAWRDSVHGRSVTYAGGGGAYLRFDAPPYAYVVYSASGRGWGSKSGVMVLDPARSSPSVRRCTAPARSQLGLALFERAGLQTDDQELELPAP